MELTSIEREAFTNTETVPLTDLIGDVVVIIRGDRRRRLRVDNVEGADVLVGRWLTKAGADNGFGSVFATEVSQVESRYA